jgi:hypothetical protein
VISVLLTFGWFGFSFLFFGNLLSEYEVCGAGQLCICKYLICGMYLFLYICKCKYVDVFVNIFNHS